VLPIRAPLARSTLKVVIDPPVHPANGEDVFVVDDMKTIRDLVSLQLQQLGCRPEAFESAEQCLEALTKRQKAAKTVDAYARNLEDLLRTWPETPPERIVEADFADIEHYLERLVVERCLSDATIQQRLVTARLFFDFCLQRSLRRNPVNPVPRGSGRGLYPRRGLVPRRQRLPWLPTDTDWDALLADLQLLALRRPNDAAEVLLAYLSRVNDEWLKVEVLTALEAVAVRQGRPDPAVTAALNSSDRLQRQTALGLLGRDGGVFARRACRRNLHGQAPSG